MLEGDFSIDVLRCIAAHVSPRTAEAQTLSNLKRNRHEGRSSKDGLYDVSLFVQLTGFSRRIRSHYQHTSWRQRTHSKVRQWECLWDFSDDERGRPREHNILRLPASALKNQIRFAAACWHVPARLWAAVSSSPLTFALLWQLACPR